MKYGLIIPTAVLGLASMVRGNLLVGVFNSNAAMAEAPETTTVLEFDNSGNQITSFNPGPLGETVQNVAVFPSGNYYSIVNNVGSVFLT
jgi:hypothetical protein